MANLGLTAVFTLFFASTFFSQQLIINEVSQGTGSSEYVEFVVIGNSTCIVPVPCIDLRKVIIDDNNGYFAPGSGAGIATGAVRFADNPFWSCVPQGTFIVIYNEGSPNTSLPPDDSSLTDGNCRLILPASSNLLEVTTVSSPSTITNLYPPDGSWITGGLWSTLAMSNSNDSFQIPNLAVNGTPLHAVSWGNNMTGSIIYFSGSASNKVFSFVNSFSNDWNAQVNWVAGDVGVNETPGAPNSPDNDAWIAVMNPECGTPLPIVASVFAIAESCSGLCDGSANVIMESSESQYTFLWQNGDTTQQISNVCPGEYTVIITANDACQIDGISLTVTVQAGGEFGDPSITVAGPFTINDPPYQINSMTSGGSWTSNCQSCLSTLGVFDPTLSGVGSFQVCYQIGVDACAQNDCILITVTEDCSPQTTSESISICQGDSIYIFSQWESSEGIYSNVFTLENGCDSTHSINISYFPVVSLDEYLTMCQSDSISISGNWIYENGVYTIQEQNVQGCFFDHVYHVTYDSCMVEPLIVYIPNSFTPNEDGTNDLFKIEILGGVVESGFVMNRWGNVVTTFDENTITWDGKYSNGKMVQDGIYIYVVHCFSDEQFRSIYRGFVTLIR